MGRLRRYSLLIAVVLLMLVAVQVVACGDDGDDDDDEEPTGIPTATVTPAPTAKPSPTPALAPTPTATPEGGIDISRAAEYLDASAVLPDLTDCDSAASVVPPAANPRLVRDAGPDGNDFADWLGDESAQMCYRNKDEMIMIRDGEIVLQNVQMYMIVVSEEGEKARWRQAIEDEEVGIPITLWRDLPQEQQTVTTVTGESNVGDISRRFEATTNASGQPEAQSDVLVFYQEVGPDAAVVWVKSVWSGPKSESVDVETIAQEVSSRIGLQ